MLSFDRLTNSLAEEELPPQKERPPPTQRPPITKRASMDQCQRPPSIGRGRDSEYDKAERILGKGPMRFAPSRFEPTVEEQIESLLPHEADCLERLKGRRKAFERDNQAYGWSARDGSGLLCDEIHLRFARFSDFDYDGAVKSMKSYDPIYLDVKCTDIEDQLFTKTLFIPPGLRTGQGLDVLYMKPSRYFPNETPTSAIIDNLAYCLQVMLEQEKCSRQGVGFMANMDGWTRQNFSISYCAEFMKMLQGHVVPIHVRVFLIVNPPIWFDVIWKIMKDMLSKEFAKRVHMIQAKDLNKFLLEGYTVFLPNDMDGGQCRVESAVSDFVKYRKYVEGERGGDDVARGKGGGDCRGSYFRSIVRSVVGGEDEVA